MVVARPTDLHRVFIQTMLSRRVVRDEVGLQLYMRAVSAVKLQDEDFRLTHPQDATGFSAFMNELSDILGEFGMSIVRGREETKAGKWFWAIVNTDPTGPGAEASDYDAKDLTYFREVVEEIVQSYPANSIGTVQAFRIANEQEPTKLTKVQAEALLKTYVSRGWLARSERGRFSLAPRGQLELETYLLKAYEDTIKRCRRCAKTVFSGKVCANDQCDAHFHHYCYRGLPRRTGQGASCPACKVSFEQVKPNYIGEKAVSRAEDDYRGNRKRKRGRPSRAGARDDEEGEEEEDDEEEEEQDFEEEEQSRRRSQGGAQTTQAGAGPSRWVASGTERRNRPSVVPETQLDD